MWDYFNINFCFLILSDNVTMCIESPKILLPHHVTYSAFHAKKTAVVPSTEKSNLTAAHRDTLDFNRPTGQSTVYLYAAAQVSNPLLPALRCLREGCPEGEFAVYMLIQCTPLLVEKAGVAPDMTLCTSKYKCKGENHPGFESHGEGHTESKIGNQWPHKMDLGPTKKKEEFECNIRWLGLKIELFPKDLFEI